MNTRALIGAYQQASKTAVDCWPSETVLDASARQGRVGGNIARCGQQRAAEGDGPWHAIGSTSEHAPAPACSLWPPRHSPQARAPSRKAAPTLRRWSRRSGRRHRPAASRAPCSTARSARSPPIPRSPSLRSVSRSTSSRPAPTSSTSSPTSASTPGAGRPPSTRALLDAIEAAYGVDRHVLLAIWGIESAYGTAKGTRSVVRSLATLAMVDPRRAALLDARAAGGAAPAAGQCGEPCRTRRLVGRRHGPHAVHPLDLQRPRRRLRQGRPPRRLGQRRRRAGLDRELSARARAGPPARPGASRSRSLPTSTTPGPRPAAPRTMTEWLTDGVRLADERTTSVVKQPLQLVLPAGARGPAFLVSRNLRALLRYNQLARLRPGRRPPRRPHCRRRRARRCLAGRRQVARPAPSARSCNAC